MLVKMLFWPQFINLVDAQWYNWVIWNGTLCRHLPVVVSSSGYDMSTFIRRYSRYLNEKSFAYRQMSFDFVRVKKGWASSLFPSFLFKSDWFCQHFKKKNSPNLAATCLFLTQAWYAIKGSHLIQGFLPAKCAVLLYVVMQKFKRNRNKKTKAKKLSDWHWKAVGV